MEADSFRQQALSLPEAVESAHMGTADFRVRGKIFATLSPENGRGVLKLTPEQQAMLVDAEPTLFQPVPGRWGGHGWTWLRFAECDAVTLASALAMAWRNVAPKGLVAAHPEIGARF